MKRFLAVFLCAVMVLSLAACGNTDNDNKKPDNDNQIENPAEDENTPEEAVSYVPLDILNTVWDSYAEDDKFPAAGGENMGGPGEMTGDYGSPDMLDYLLGLPADCNDMVTDVAGLMHMMNANTFTGGAYKVVESADAASVAEAIKNNILNRQWMCGFPDKLFVASVGDCLVSAFGHEEIIAKFKENLVAAYPDTAFICEEDLAG